MRLQVYENTFLDSWDWKLSMWLKVSLRI